jgi:hypothetical protein
MVAALSPPLEGEIHGTVATVILFSQCGFFGTPESCRLVTQW